MSSKKPDESPEASPLKGPAPKAIPEDTSDVAFEDGVPLNPMAADQSVQFISGTPANGDAKVEIGDSSATAPTFVGLGKEELMKYANDPFWVKLRWFLFILFWVLWIAMLAGAIVIIVLAPRCAEKKTAGETYYEMKASDLIKDSRVEDNTNALKDLGVQAIVISDALQHQPGEPEAVTDFEKFGLENEGLLVTAIEKLRSHGIKILLRIVPNHSGTSHMWFNESSTAEKYVRKPIDEVAKSVWVTQDSKHTAWSNDTRAGFEGTSYLQQFSGNVADLNFRNDDIIDAFKQTLKSWRDKYIDGFSIGKASFLVEDLENLMTNNATINQPDNVKVLSRITGVSSKGPILVELNDASDEVIQQYVVKGMIPLLKPGDLSNPADIQAVLETLNKNPQAVVNLAQQRSPDKARLVNLLVSAAGSHSLLDHDSSSSDSEFLKKLVEFQKNNPRGARANVTISTQGNIVAVMRSDGDDDHLILANMGPAPESYNPTSKGVVVLATSKAEQKADALAEGNITLQGLSGLVIKLAKQEEP